MEWGEFLIIPTSSQNDITLPCQLNASIAGHKSGVARLHCTVVKGVKCPEMMLTMVTKATLQSYRVSAAIKSMGFSMHLWKRALTDDLRIFICVYQDAYKIAKKNVSFNSSEIIQSYQVQISNESLSIHGSQLPSSNLT